MPRLLLALALAAALAPATAEARPTKVALVALEISGDGAPELRPQLAESIARGLARADVATVELATVQEALTPSPELIGCFSSTCLERIGDKVGADGFVRGRVGADGADYKVELELYDRAKLVHRLELPCAVCTIGELNQLALELSTRLLAEASDAPVQVVIRTEPAGAELTIDGLARGPEPFEGTLPRGPHFVVAEIKGAEVKRRIEVTEDSGPEPIVITFPGASSGLGAGPGADPPGARSLGTVKWITGGVAVAAFGVGATLLILDGRETCNGSGRTCPEIYDTALPGWVAIGVGGATAVAAGWMFYADRPARHIAVTPTPGGATAVWRGEF